MAMTKDRRERLQYVRGILEVLFGVVPMENKTVVKSALNAIESVLEEDEEENFFREIEKMKYIKATDSAEIIADRLGIDIGDLVDIFAEIPTAKVKEADE